MLFKNEKYKKDVRDVMLVFFYLGFIFIMLSSIFSYTFFSNDILVIGIIFLGIGSGMAIIIVYYYKEIKQKKTLKISLERMLSLCMILGILLLLSTIVLLFYIKIRVF